eukprot:COSAG05_NODE_872_length_6839_cov_16.232938_5_plen_231_part_00
MPGVRVAHSVRVSVRHPKHACKARRCRRRAGRRIIRRRARNKKYLCQSQSCMVSISGYLNTGRLSLSLSLSLSLALCARVCVPFEPPVVICNCRQSFPKLRESKFDFIFVQTCIAQSPKLHICAQRAWLKTEHGFPENSLSNPELSAGAGRRADRPRRWGKHSLPFSVETLPPPLSPRQRLQGSVAGRAPLVRRRKRPAAAALTASQAPARADTDFISKPRARASKRMVD